jgi:hypothetical protein
VLSANNYTIQDIAAVGSNGEYVVLLKTHATQTVAETIRVQKVNADGTITGQNMVTLQGGNGTWFYNVEAKVTALGATGEFVVVWQSKDTNGANDIVVQRFNADGTVKGSAVQLNSASGFEAEPQVTALTNGEFAVSWSGNDSGNIKIFVQKFNADGTTTGQSQVTLEATGVASGSDSSPQITRIGSGGEYVVTWSGQDSGGDTSIYVQKFASNGTVSGSAVKLEPTNKTDGADITPQITATADGGYVVTWSGVDSTGYSSIFTQKFNATGSKLGSVTERSGFGLPVSYFHSTDITPQITAIGNSGEFVVTWSCLEDYSPNKVPGELYVSTQYVNYVQKYNADGSASGSAVRLKHPVGNQTNDGASQVLSLGNTGEIIVAWSHRGESIEIAKFGSDGALVSNPSRIKIDTEYGLSALRDTTPLLTALGDDGAFAVAWRGGLSGNLVFTKSFMPSEINSSYSFAVNEAVYTAYLVNDTVTVNTLDDILASIAAGLSDLSDRTYTLPNETYYLYAVDGGGNLSQPSVEKIVLNRPAVTQTISNIQISVDTGSNNTDFITNIAQQTFTATLSAPLNSSEFVMRSYDGGSSWNSYTVIVDGTTITSTPHWGSVGNTLWEGSNTILLRVVGTDKAPGSVASQAYVLDTTAPTVSITDDTSGSATGAVTYTFTFSEAVTGFDATDVVLSAGSKGTFTTVNSSQYTLAITPPSGNGTLTVDVAAGAATDTAGNLSTIATQNSQAYIAPVIDLGDYGKLIAPVQIDGGQWFYYWDRSGDGTNADIGSLNGGVDSTTHDVLDGLFNHDINGTANTTVLNADGAYGTTDTYRYATLNGVHLALPAYGWQLNSGGTNVDAGITFSNESSFASTGTAVGDAVTPSNGSNATNAVYNDLLAIWDAYNGTGNTQAVSNGVPTSWASGIYWSATMTGASGDTSETLTPGHALLGLNTGYLYGYADTTAHYVALQVL